MKEQSFREAVAIAVVKHDTFLHHFLLAQNCALAQTGDDWTTRWSAHLIVRDFCAAQMRQSILDLADENS